MGRQEPNKFFKGFVYAMAFMIPFWTVICLIVYFVTRNP